MQRRRGGAQYSRAGRPGGLIMVSNRGPIEHYVGADGELRQRPAGGGVAVALGAAARKNDITWLASCGSPEDAEVASRSTYIPYGERSRVRLLPIDHSTYAAFYSSFANPVLWFIQHGLSSLLETEACEVSRAWTEGYVPVNRLFADAVVREMDRRGANRVMLHDYHFYLCARMIRRKRPEVALQHFTHIPWPELRAWEVLPGAIVAQICRGLLGNDSVVFQTNADAANFLDTCRSYLRDEASVCSRDGEVRHEGRTTRVWANPISVDTDEIEAMAMDPDILRWSYLVRRCNEEKLIVRVDRLDPSKNALRGFDAFETLLEKDANLRGKVRFVAYLVPTRESLQTYRDYADAVARRVEQINVRFGRPDWQPVQVVSGHNRSRALAGLKQYDVLLVNSIADGMNLVAKEGIVLNQRDGVLVLSRSAGAHQELADGAIDVDPEDTDATVKALQRALHMAPAERADRARRMKSSVSGHQLGDWFQALHKDLEITDYLHRAFPYPRLMPAYQAIPA